MRVSLEQKLNYFIDNGFDINFSFCEKNRKGKQVLWMFDNNEYVLPITGKDINSVITEAYKLEAIYVLPETNRESEEDKPKNEKEYIKSYLDKNYPYNT